MLATTVTFLDMKYAPGRGPLILKVEETFLSLYEPGTFDIAMCGLKVFLVAQRRVVENPTRPRPGCSMDPKVTRPRKD